MKTMNYFLKISLASLLAVTMMTLSSSSAMCGEPGMAPTYFPMPQPIVIPMGFDLHLRVDPKPVQINIDPYTIKLAVMGGLLVVGLYGIFQLLNAQSGPRYAAAGLTTAAIAAGICCIKYSEKILGQ